MLGASLSCGTLFAQIRPDIEAVDQIAKEAILSAHPQIAESDLVMDHFRYKLQTRRSLNYSNELFIVKYREISRVSHYTNEVEELYFYDYIAVEITPDGTVKKVSEPTLYVSHQPYRGHGSLAPAFSKIDPLSPRSPQKDGDTFELARLPQSPKTLRILQAFSDLIGERIHIDPTVFANQRIPIRRPEAPASDGEAIQMLVAALATRRIVVEPLNDQESIARRKIFEAEAGGVLP